MRRILPTVRPVTKERQFQEIDRLVNFGPAATLSSSRQRPTPPHGHSPRAPPPPPHGPPPHRSHYHNVHHHQHDHPHHQHHQGPPHLDLSTAPTPPLVNEDTQSPQSSSQPSTTSSTIDGPVAGGAAMHAGVGKGEHVVRIEVAEDDTMTVPAVTTPKAA